MQLIGIPRAVQTEYNVGDTLEVTLEPTVAGTDPCVQSGRFIGFSRTGKTVVFTAEQTKAWGVGFKAT